MSHNDSDHSQDDAAPEEGDAASEIPRDPPTPPRGRSARFGELRAVPTPVDPDLPPGGPPYYDRPPIPWDDIRRLYVQGIPCGPGLPDQTELLESVGEGDAFEKERSYGKNSKSARATGATHKITKVGKIKVVFPNIRNVARHFGAPEKPVQMRARDEDWYGLQRMYRAQLKQRAGNLRTRERLIDVDKIDRQALATAKMGLRMIRERMETMRQTVEVMDGAVHPVIDSRELESLARSAQVWHALGRRALGFPVEQTGVMKTQEALALSEMGLAPVAGFEDDDDREVLELLGFVGRELEEGGLLTDGARPSVASELARDDAERLHGFLSVLGRAQEASQQGANGNLGGKERSA